VKDQEDQIHRKFICPSPKPRLISQSHQSNQIIRKREKGINKKRNNMSSSSTSFSPDQHLSPSDQLCYVHCNFCDTVLAVSSITLFFTFLIIIISLLMQSNTFLSLLLLLKNLGQCSLLQFV